MFFTDPDTDSNATAPLYTREGLNAFLSAPIPCPTVRSRSEYLALDTRTAATYDSARIRFLSGGVLVNTRQLTEARRDIGKRMAMNSARNGDNRMLMLSGDPTLGKTTTTKALMRYVHTNYRKQFPDFVDQGRTPVVYIPVPTGCTPKLLMHAMLRFFGLTAGRTETADSMKTRVISILKLSSTQLIVIDELQNLAPTNRGNGESIDVLKQVQDAVRATFVYAGIDLKDSALLSGVKGKQLRGRATTTELTRYNGSNLEHVGDWRGIITQFENQLPLADHPAGFLLEHAGYLRDRTNGSIGSLAMLLTGVAIDLICDPANPHETITRELLDAYVIDDAAEDAYANRPAATTLKSTTAKTRKTAA